MSLFLGITQKFKLDLRAALKTYSRYSILTVSSDLHLFRIRLFLTAWQPITCIGLGTGTVADALIAFSMCWFLYHKRTGFARRVRFSLFTPQIWLSFVRRTDSMIMKLMSYSINSGLLTWWDLDLRQSDTMNNPNSVVTTGVLITVSSSSLVFCRFGSSLCCDQYSISPSSMIWEIFYWPMSKSTCSIIPNEETIELTFVL